MDNFDQLQIQRREVIIAACDYIDQVDHGLYKDTPKSLKNLREAVALYRAETE